MTRRQTRSSSSPARRVFAVIFIGLTIHSHTRFAELTHAEAITPEVIAGKHVWHRKNCINCHTLLGEGAYYAPDLTKITQHRGEAYLRQFLQDPSRFYSEERHGRVMPNPRLSDQQITHVIAFLTWISNIDNQNWPPRPILVSAASPQGIVLGTAPARRRVGRPGGARRSALPPLASRLLQLSLARRRTSCSSARRSPASRRAPPTSSQGSDLQGSARTPQDYIRESIVNPHAYVVPGPTFSRRRTVDHAAVRHDPEARGDRSARRLSRDVQVRGAAGCAIGLRPSPIPTSSSPCCSTGCRWRSGCSRRRSTSVPIRIKAWLPFDVSKAIHTNLLIVWVLTGFMGAAYWLVPEESRTELHSPKMAYVALGLWTLAGVTAVVGYLFGWTAGNKLLEQPLPVKLAIVVVMLMFLYNLGMTIWKAKRLTTTEGILMAGLALTAILYLPSLFEFDNYTVAIFYRWWTVHLWVEGVWEMIQGALLAYLLIRLSGIDREVMEKWLYVIVGLTFISGLLGTAHHYYFVGVPSVLASDRRFLLGARAAGLRGHVGVRLSGHPAIGALRTRTRSPCTGLSAARSSPRSAPGCSASRTPGRPSTSGRTARSSRPMHGHSAFFGAYVMIVLAVITYAMPALMGHAESQRESKIGLWAFWLQVGGMFGMTMALRGRRHRPGVSRTDPRASATSRPRRRSRCTS